MQFAEIEQRIDFVKCNPELPNDPSADLLNLSEQIIENWLIVKGRVPTQESREGYRLLALHRQAAKGDPSFNACRESCRELIYNLNLYRLNGDSQSVVMSAMLAMHLMLFIQGKLQDDKIGEFCCSSKNLRTKHRDFN